MVGHDGETGGLLASYFHPEGTCWDATRTAVATFAREEGGDSGEDTAPDG